MGQTQNSEFIDFIMRIARNSGLTVQLLHDSGSYTAIFSDGTKIVYSLVSGVARAYVKKPVEKDRHDCYNPSTGGAYGQDRIVT